MITSSRSFVSCALALPLMTVSAIVGTSTAQAEVPADSKAVLTQRFDELGTHFHGGQLARWSDPSDRAALEKVWDVSAVLGRPPYSSSDVRVLVEILKAEVELLQKYTKAGGATPGSPKEALVRAKYQDEIVRGSAFLATASAATLQAIGDFAAKIKPDDLKPQRLQGLDQGRAGVRSIVEALGTELRFSGVSPENKMLLIDALVANAPTIAAYSPDADRKGYAEAAKAVLPALSEAEKAKLQPFVAAMDTKDCKGLCVLKG